MDNQDLKYIKKVYGENFAKLCRELFPQILETPGLLKKIITEKFDPSPTLYNDMIEVEDNFKNYVFSFVDVENNNKDVVNKSPEKLFDKAGYILYPECQTEDDIQRFKKYYKSGEELCTFRGGRLKSCRVWFAVKKNVNKIRRKIFAKPTREDEYGTSVISIQFTRGSRSTLSIKNRYNHTVNNPDNTFESNLDNIIPGLTSSFCQKYGIDLINNKKEEFHPDGYVLGRDGKLYKINVEIDAINYCANNTIIYADGSVEKYDKSKYILVDHYLIDLVGKKIKKLSLDGLDGFVDSIGEIKNIAVSLDENKNRVIDITPESGENVKIVVNRSNQIVEYINKNVTSITEFFMSSSMSLTKLDLQNVETVGNYFLWHNRSLKEINMPNLKTVGNNFLLHNKEIQKLSLPNLESTGGYFLSNNKILSELNLPNLQSVGWSFLYVNEGLTKLDLPNLRVTSNDFLYDNTNIRELNLPKLEKVGTCFLFNNNNITKLDLPNLETVGEYFFRTNVVMTELNLPKLKYAKDSFLWLNKKLQTVNMPNLAYAGNYVLSNNKDIKDINLPRLESVGSYFFEDNTIIKKLDFPNLVRVGSSFFTKGENIEEINLPNLRFVEDDFMSCNTSLTELNLPNVKLVGSNFLSNNTCLQKVNMPRIKRVGDNFLPNYQKSEEFENSYEVE